MIKVGRPIPGEPYKGKQTLRYMYRDVAFDSFGWADVKDFLPMDYDLIQVKTDKGKIYSAGHTGQEWDGKNITPESNVIAWRRHNENTDSL